MTTALKSRRQKLVEDSFGFFGTFFPIESEHIGVVVPAGERGGRFIECGLEWMPDARRFEAGSLNTNGIHGLRAAIDLLLEIGISSIAAEVIPSFRDERGDGSLAGG